MYNYGGSAMAKRKFDCVVMNPPYQSATKGGNGARDLWPFFVEKAISLVKENGYIISVNPSRWRKPEHNLYPIFQSNNLIYLEIHDNNDGRKTFGAITRYDWYILQKSKYNGNTIIKDENGDDSKVNIEKLPFIPNYLIDKVMALVAKDNQKKCEVIYSSSIYDARKEYMSKEKCEVIYSRTIYGCDKKWMSKEKDETHTFPCVYGMYKDKTCSYLYSNKNNGHFGTSKVILGIGQYLYPLIDMDGKYGMSNNAFAIKVDSIEEAEGIKKAIESESFREIVKATKWGNFQTDYKMFQSFRKDFWKEFI